MLYKAGTKTVFCSAQVSEEFSDIISDFICTVCDAGAHLRVRTVAGFGFFGFG